MNYLDIYTKFNEPCPVKWGLNASEIDHAPHRVAWIELLLPIVQFSVCQSKTVPHDSFGLFTTFSGLFDKMDSMDP